MAWPDTPDAYFYNPGAAIASGDWGEDSYGDSSYGGTLGAAPFLLGVPETEIPGDSLLESQGKGHGLVGAVAHRRNGILIGERVWDSASIWSVHWSYALDGSFIATLRLAFETRFFRLVHDPGDFNIYTPVHWVEDEFQARTRRGGNWEISFTLEAYAGAEIVPS